MEILMVGGIEIDGCPHCAGIWCDSKELEKIQKIEKKEVSRFIKSYWEASLREEKSPSSLERELCCPVCGLAMVSHHHRPGSRIILDSCRGKCGKWLDGGELRLLMEHEKNGVLISLLRALGAPFRE